MHHFVVLQMLYCTNIKCRGIVLLNQREAGGYRHKTITQPTPHINLPSVAYYISLGDADVLDIPEHPITIVNSVLFL